MSSKHNQKPLEGRTSTKQIVQCHTNKETIPFPYKKLGNLRLLKFLKFP